MFVRSAAEACAGRFEAFRDGAGAIGPFVPLTTDEVQQNCARTDGRRLTRTPLGGFATAAHGHVYYEDALAGPGPFDVERVGTGLCTFALGEGGAPASECVRGPG